MLDDKKYSNILNNTLLNFKINKLEEDFKNLKLAYPNSDDLGLGTPGEHNLPKWVQALKDVYYKNIQQKIPWKQAIDSSTEGWNPIEKLDFNNWVTFYQGGNHLKYKKANWYINEEIDENESPVMPGYMIPNAYKQIEEGGENISANETSDREKRILLDKHKKKIVSRLDSIERLLRNEEGYLLSESENDSLIDTIHSLKKKVYSLKRTAGEVFYQDLVVREANILANKGFYKAASFLYVAAQQAAPAAPPAPMEAAPPAAAPPAAAPPAGAPPVGAPPAESVPATGGAAPPVGAIGMPPAPVSPDLGGGTSPPAIGAAGGNNDELGKALTESLGGGFGESGDVNSSDDNLFVSDDEMNEGQEDQVEIEDDNFLTSFAQLAPPVPAPPVPVPPAQPPPPSPKQPPKSIKETDLTSDVKSPPADIVVEEFDKNLESVLSKITVEDVLRKMEQISKIFKTREIPRQLSVIDMMLDHLGLASFFPSLSEATNKALESNNYILTRIEDIIMQLSGAVKTKNIDLAGNENDTPEHAMGVRRNLEDQEKTDKERKEMRKELADKALEERSKEDAPDLEVTEDDLEPTPAPAAPPIPVKQPLPPAV